MNRFALLRPEIRAPATPTRSHTGYISFEGKLSRSEKEYPQLKALINALNLTPVKKIHFRFDPFDRDTRGIRTAMHALSIHKVRGTNPKCTVKTDVLSDGGEASMRVELNEGKDLVFKTGRLQGVEILYHFNKFILPKVKLDTGAGLTTKAAKLQQEPASARKGRKK